MSDNIVFKFRQDDEPKEVIRIASDGNVYWNGRLVESDEEFKSAMLDLRNCMMTATVKSNNSDNGKTLDEVVGETTK